MKRCVILKDVAEEAGVSVATASQVFNNYPNISESTRKKVWQAKETLGYSPNANARNLRVNQGRRQSPTATGSLALVIVDPLPNLNFYMTLVHGFSKAVQERDLHPLVLTLTAVPRSVREMPASLRNRGVDGLLLTGVIPPPVLAQFNSLGLPCVLLGNEDIEAECCLVKPDVAAGTLNAMKRLFALGHTAISLVSQRLDTCYHREIRDAYKLAYTRQGLVPRDEWCRNMGDALTVPSQEIEALLSLSPRPTALLFTNTRSAGLAYDQLQKSGMQVPQDMSLVTFSGTSETEIRASIDRIVVDNEALGAIGVKTLLDRISTPAQSCVSVSIPCAYVEGGSCAKVPAGS
jgi:DNA-binding LacI/PurR family transcriptional regulator